VLRLLLAHVPDLQDACRTTQHTHPTGSRTSAVGAHASWLQCPACCHSEQKAGCSLVLVLMVAKEPGALGTHAALRRAAGCFERADTCNRSTTAWESGPPPHRR
jgi:hypothetical protein